MKPEVLAIEIRNIAAMVIKYENKSIQRDALAVIPVDRLQSQTCTLLKQAQVGRELTHREVCLYWEQLFFRQLINWFRTEFFQWFDVPTCVHCHFPPTLMRIVYMDKRTPYSLYASIEVYKCRTCRLTYSFPRYIDSRQLLIKRTGRCAEWSQMFCLMSRALGWRARYVLDINDHCWVEVYSELEKRWIHCDPAEGVFDNPLMYESKWRKKMTAVIGIGCDDVQDVTWRYTTDHSAARARRSDKLDDTILRTILRVRETLQRHQPPMRILYLHEALIKELAELMVTPSPDRSEIALEVEKFKLEDTRSQYVFPASSYTWRPEPGIQKKEINIVYECLRNIYYRNIEDQEPLKEGWESGVYNYTNVARRQVLERDGREIWSLTREDGAKTAVGTISWRISTEGTNLAINKVSLSCLFGCEYNGLVKWIFRSPDTLHTTCVFNREKYETEVLSGSRELIITVFMLGGEEDRWQSAQICRDYFCIMPLPPLHINVTFIDV